MSLSLLLPPGAPLSGGHQLLSPELSLPGPGTALPLSLGFTSWPSCEASCSGLGA